MHLGKTSTSARLARKKGLSLIPFLLFSGINQQERWLLMFLQTFWILCGYLDRGEVYKQPTEFVSKLALCPRCRGGKEQTQVLKDTLLRMTALVKRKLDEQRNKKDPAGLAQDSVKGFRYFPSSQSGVDK